MGYRLSKIYTRTGDRGETGMADGSRVPKSHPRVSAIGDIDELNSQIGLLITEISNPEILQLLGRVQHILFDLGAELSLPDYQAVSTDHVTQLETALDKINATLKPLDEFILPGGCRSAALAHIARAVCRRAERQLVSLLQQPDEAPLSDTVVAYVNRLSDLLFVVARRCCIDEGVEEIYWQKSLVDKG